MTKENKIIAVTGSSGFIATNLTKRLQEQGHTVYGIDIVEPQYGIKPDVFINGDLRDPKTCEAFFNQPFDEVYALAAWMGGAGVIFTGDNDAQIMHDSALINLNTAKYATEAKVKKLFYSSSACVYSAEAAAKRASEESAYPACPDSNYGWEKIFSERLYEAYAKNYGVDVRIARFNNTYGEYSTYEGGREKSPAAICRKVMENNIEIWGDGQQVREFVYISDLLDAIELIMVNPFTGPTNIGPRENITIDGMVRILTDKPITHVDGPIGLQVRLTTYDKIEALGWSAKVPLEVGLKRLYSWIMKTKYPYRGEEYE